VDDSAAVAPRSVELGSDDRSGASEPPAVASAGEVPASGASPVVLDVRNLVTYFYTYDGVVRALEGVSFKLRRAETLGLVGETGCGKSVTMFSITRLVPDPPGRVVSGTALYRGANLLWGIESEAKFKPVKGTNRVKVKRSFRRVKAGQARVGSVRGGGIAMIFQEPSQAMNPIFPIYDQVGESILEHRGVELVGELLAAHPDPAAFEAAADEIRRAVEAGDTAALREATRRLGTAVGLASAGVQAYYLARQEMAEGRPDYDPSASLKRIARRLYLSGVQRGFLRRELQRLEAERDLRHTYFEEMRQGRSDRIARGRAQARRFRARMREFGYRLPVVKRRVSRPLRDELFWRVVQALEGVQIANPVQVARGFPHELSGGMLQRVMIAMALASDPEILMADEPTTALDVTIQAQILELMNELRHRRGTAILLVTHDLAVIAEVADRVAVMYAGQIVEMAPVKSLYARPLHPYTQGLLASIPRFDQPGKELASIPGSVPNLIYPPSGCRYHPRCPHAMPICKESRPPLTVEGENHHVACFLYSGPTVQE